MLWSLEESPVGRVDMAAGMGRSGHSRTDDGGSG